jgi:tetratricopeptide (TPR) repeat protein
MAPRIAPPAVVSLLVALVLSGCATSSGRRAPAATPAPAPAHPAAESATQNGITLYEQGRYAEAEAVLAGASGTASRAYLAAARVRLARYADAEAPAIEALRNEPAQPVAAAALGEALVAQGKTDEAIDRLSAVLRANPSLPYAHYWRGQAYQRGKRIARMAQDYEAFLRLAPDAPEAPAIRALLDSLR